MQVVVLWCSPPHLSQVPFLRQISHPIGNFLPRRRIKVLALGMELVRVPVRIQIPTREVQWGRGVLIEFRTHPANCFHVLAALKGHAPVVELDAVSDVGVSTKYEDWRFWVDCADCLEDDGPFVSE